MPLLLSLAPGAALVRDRIPSAGCARAIQRLIAGPASQHELAALALAEDGEASPGILLSCLAQLANRALLSCSLVVDGSVLAIACPVPIETLLGDDDAGDEPRWMLSRFAYVHREADTVLLETPLSPTRLTVRDARLLPLVLSPGPIPRDAACAPGGSGADLVRLLRDAGFLTPVDEQGNAQEDARPQLRAWEFHDLLFHASSRIGRHHRPYGATSRLKGILPPPPALKPPMAGTVVHLVRPSLESIERRDPPFTRVLERRRSERDHDRRPVTLDDLGRFLFRSSRARDCSQVGEFEIARRVYPGGGAAYELELYLAVNKCEGLAAGLYHYRPGDHCLSRVRGATREVKALIRAAGHTQHSAPPQILIVITARVQRLFWKYSGMAYAMVLKDVGVLFQTLHLVAEAMGLAACALGGGNADLFADASGVDYYEEPSVAEFTLGRRVRPRRPGGEPRVAPR